MSSSAIFLVSVVTRTRSSRSDAHPDLLEQIVDLALRRLDHDLRVDQTGRADDLLDHAVRDPHLVLAGRRGEVHGLADAVLELVPPQRPVVEGARQSEAMLDQRALAGRIALVHGADLRHGHVRLVDHDEEVVGKVVEQAVAEPRPADGRRCGASSSRCRSRIRSAPSSRGRTGCACAAAGPRAACPRAPAPAGARAVPPGWCRSPAASSPGSQRSGSPGRPTRRPSSARPRRSAGAASTAPRSRRRTARRAPRAPRTSG